MKTNLIFGNGFIQNVRATGKLTSVHVPAMLLVIFLMALFSLSCSRQSAPDDGLVIAVSIPPHAWFVSEIAGDKAWALVLVPPGQNPHTFEMTPRQLESLSSASAWIRCGLDFEISLLPRIAPLFQNLLIVDGTEGVHFRLLESHAHKDEMHGEEDDDDDEGHGYSPSPLEIDRHTWLGREPAKILAAHIRDVLSHLDYKNAEFYSERTDTLIREIDAVFDELSAALAPLSGRSVFVYHPSFGYFFDEFGIYQEAVETGGSEPTPRQLSDLLDSIAEDNPAAIFVQMQFPVTAARTLADAVDAQLVELDPLAFDWLDNIRRMGYALQAAIR